MNNSKKTHAELIEQGKTEERKRILELLEDEIEDWKIADPEKTSQEQRALRMLRTRIQRSSEVLTTVIG